jgi:hypothetical protein
MSGPAEKIVLFPLFEFFADELGRLLQPNLFFQHPRDVVRDLTLTRSEKRAILSSWAVGSCALEPMPALGSGSGRVIRFDDVIDALRDLDSKPPDIDIGRGSRRRRRARDRGGAPEDGSMGGGNWC